MPASINPFRTLAVHPNFRRFWLGQTASLVGSWMQSMAQGWLALQLSDSAFLVGVVAAAGSVPILLFSFHAGVLVDRVDKLRLVKLCQALFLVDATVLWWFTWSGHVTIGWLIALATLNGLIFAFEIPARQSLVIELVGREDLPGAIALNSSGFNLARVLGPSLGAALIAGLGLEWCFAFNALSYFAVLVGLFLVKLPPWHPPDTRASPLEGIREGIRFMRHTPAVAALMRVVTVYSVLGVPFIVLMPVVARDQLGMGAGGYGLLLACVGIGGLAGALTLAAVGDRFSRGQILSVASFAFSTLLVAFALVRTSVAASIVLLLTGFAMIVNNAASNAMLQQLVPDALRGRMMAAYSFVVVGLSQVVGSFLAGAIARVSSASAAIGLGGVVLIGYSYLAFVRSPQLRRQ